MMAEVAGLEPTSSVLETDSLSFELKPLYVTYMFR